MHRDCLMKLRIMFLVHPGTNSRDIFLDIIEGYQQAGHQTFLLDLGAYWTQRDKTDNIGTQIACITLYSGLVYRFILDNSIDLCISMWSNGVYSFPPQEGKSFFEKIGLPHLMYWLDAPQWAQDGMTFKNPPDLLNGPVSFHCINNSSTAAEMENILGFSNVLIIPNAANPNRMLAHLNHKKEFDIIFNIGREERPPTDVMLQELAKDDPDINIIRRSEGERLRPKLIEITKKFFSNTTEEFVNTMIHLQIEKRHIPVLQKLLNIKDHFPLFKPGLIELMKNHISYIDFSMNLRNIEAWERKFTFPWLSKYFNTACFGPGNFDGWPGNWTALGELPYNDITDAYGKAYFGLNIMRWQDDKGLNIKPFEITLSGACLLQGYRKGFEEFFNRNEAVSFFRPCNCKKKVTHLLQNPALLAKMTRKGYERSRSDHCWSNRAQFSIEMIIKEKNNIFTA